MSNSVVYEVIDGYESADNCAEYILYLYQAKDQGNIDLYCIKKYMQNVHGGKCVRFLDSAMDFARSGINDSETEFGSAAGMAEFALAEIEGLGLEDREIVCKSDGVSHKIGDILRNYVEYRKTIQTHVDKMWIDHMKHMELQSAIANSVRARRVIEVGTKAA